MNSEPLIMTIEDVFQIEGRVKKLAIIFLVAVIAVVVAGVQLQRSFDVRETFTYGHTGRITRLGRDLIERRSSHLIIGVHPALNEKLDELGIRATSEFHPSVVRGDAPAPIGDGRGTQHLIIHRLSDHQHVLGVRLAYERATRTYHILGFWTPANP